MQGGSPAWQSPFQESEVGLGRSTIRCTRSRWEGGDERSPRGPRQSQPEICPGQSTDATRKKRSSRSFLIRQDSAARVGFVDEGGTVPKQLRHQQWSSFNVPLMWAAAPGDADSHLLQWLEARAERLPPMWVGDQQILGGPAEGGPTERGGGFGAKGSGAKVVANFGQNGLRMRCAGAKNKDK